MSGRISPGEGEPWYPESEHFNWREIWLAKLATEGEVERPPLYFHVDDDGYSQEVTEENTMVFFNQAIDGMDGVAIIDERDGKPWWWFRDLHPYFDELVQSVGPYATIIHNDCPQDQVEHNYLRIKQGIIDGNIPHEMADSLRPKELMPGDPIDAAIQSAHDEIEHGGLEWFLGEWAEGRDGTS